MSMDVNVPVISSLSFAHPTVHARQRERLTIPEDEITAALRNIEDGPEEVAVLSTCLRHEVMAVGATENEMRDLVRKMSGVAELPEPAEFRYGSPAVHHLFRVTAGLCSPVVGEAEILGQVRRAHRAAQQAESIGPILDALFRGALNTGRAAREVLPEQDAGSIAAIAVDHVREGLPGRLLLVGAGEMANAVYEAMHGSGWETVRTTRRPERLGAGAVSLDHLEDELQKADVAVTAVTKHKPIIDTAMLARVAALRSIPLTIIDLGMPANVAPAEIPGIDYLGIDDLADDDRHRLSTGEAEEFVEMQAVDAHARVMNTTLSGLIRALRDKAEQASKEELDRALGRLRNADEHDREVVAEMAHKLTNRLLHDPLLYLSSHPEAVATSDTARTILGIDDEGDD